MEDITSVLAKLHEINTAYSRPLTEQPLSKVFQEVSARLVSFLNVDHSTVTLLDESRRFFRVEAEYPPLATRVVGQRIPIEGRATQFSLVNRCETVVANDLKSHALISESLSFRQTAEALDIRSLMITPMVIDGNIIGTISVDTIGRTKSFTNEEIELCQTVANQTAAFVEIIRLRDEQQKYRRQAKLLTPVPKRATVSDREEKVAQALFDKLGKVIPFKKASLQLIVEGKRILVGAFGFDKSCSHPWLVRPVEADPIIRDIVHTQRPKILPNTAADSRWEKKEGTFDVNSWIGMPLVAQGQTIGILTLDHDQVGAYADISEDTLASLDELAGQAAQDIRDAYNLAVAQQQIQALEIVRRFAETVATKLVLRDLLLAIVSTISKGLECTRCSIFLAEQREQRDCLMCKATCEALSCRVVSESELPYPRRGQLPCPVHQAFRIGDSNFVEDRDQGQDCHFDFAHESYQGARSIIAVPLKISKHVMGVVLAVHERPGWFSKADLLLLETLAKQAASAIERDNGLDLVHSIGNKLLGATEVGAVLEDVVSGAMKLIHTDSGVIYELNDECTDVLHTFMPKGSDHPKPRLNEPEGITRTVITTQKMLEIPDIRKNRCVNPELRKRFRSMFAVPLMLGESVVGVLYLNCRNVRKLTETEKSLLATLAAQAALAIQRARLYEQIKDSAMTYRSLFDNIPQRVCWKDTHSRFIWANASFCQSLGRSLKEVKGKSDVDFYPENDAKKYVRDDQKVMRSKQPVVLDEKNQPLANTPPVWVRVAKTPVLDAHGQVKGVQAIFWNITKEKQMTERWRSLVEQSPDSIVIHKNRKIVLSNPAAVRLFGAKSSKELEGLPILNFIDESSRPLATERLKQLMNKQAVAPMVEMRIRKKTGETVDVEVYTWRGPLKNEVQVVFHDVTRSKTLLREMHHRVRRSFNQVNGFLTLQEQFAESQEVSHAFDTIRERIQAMALVHLILYRTGKESAVNMDLYLKELKEALLRAQGTSEQIAVDFAASGIILNEKQATACGLIVNELVSNSLLHAFPRGASPRRKRHVSVSLRSKADMLRLEVSDNGIGMPGPSKTTGEGMGLSLVRTLVLDDLKGRMKVSSARPGTCFTIEFEWARYRKDIRDGT